MPSNFLGNEDVGYKSICKTSRKRIDQCNSFVKYCFNSWTWKFKSVQSSKSFKSPSWWFKWFVWITLALVQKGHQKGGFFSVRKKGYNSIQFLPPPFLVICSSYSRFGYMLMQTMPWSYSWSYSWLYLSWLCLSCHWKRRGGGDDGVGCLAVEKGVWMLIRTV